MIIRHYDDNLSADDFVHEEKVKKMRAFKEKKSVKPLNLERLPVENDTEVKQDAEA